MPSLTQYLFVVSSFVCALTAHNNLGRASSPEVSLLPQAKLDPNWHVEVICAQHGPKEAWLQVSGRIAYDEENTQHVTSALRGRVSQVLVKAGDFVEAGQPLVAIVSPEAAQLRTELQKDREDLRSAEASRKRSRALLREGATSAREAAEAEASYNKAQAEFARDAAHLEALGLSLKGPGTAALLLARQKGVVTERHVFAGQELRGEAAEPLLTISNLSQVWMFADVYEQDLAQVQAGASVRVQVPAYPQESFEGTLDHVGDVVDAQNHAVKVRCVLQNDSRRLKPQMFATARLQTARASLVVASGAVIHQADHAYVLVVAQDNALQLREVVLGPLHKGHYPLLSGLAEGERIVGKQALFVFDATRRP